MRKFLRDRPWIWIVLSFLIMMAVMVTVVAVAERYAPADVPLDNPQSEQNAQ